MKFFEILVLALLPQLVLPLLHAADDPPRDIEIKLIVTPENVTSALESLDLDRDKPDAKDVCFFDTAEGTLAAHDLTFRVRQGIGKSGDSVVKIRAAEDSSVLTEVEQAIPIEQDWTNRFQPVISRALTFKFSQKGLLAKVVTGVVPARDLLSDAQKTIITRRIPDFRFGSLKRYGPVKTEVWKSHRKFEGFPEPVTVELWQLDNDGRTEQLLEVSAKAQAGSNAHARAQAIRFFDAAKSFGMGSPSPQTKTRKVLDFYKPGR